MDTNTPPDTDLSEQAIEPLLALLSLGMSLTLMGLTITAMRHAPEPARGFYTPALMLLLSAVPFWGSLCAFLHAIRKATDDEAGPLHIAAKLFGVTLLFLLIPLATYVGDRYMPSQPLCGWIASTVAVLIVLVVRSIEPSGLPIYFLRGTYMLQLQYARRQAASLVQRGEPTINWIGIYIPLRFAEQHFALIGATGSGKTVALRLLMQSILPRILPGSDCRALIYDPKNDMAELLSGMSISCPILFLNPFDQRSVAWDMACDITTPAIALQAASLIIQEEGKHGENSFFTKAARDLFTAVMVALHHVRPHDWTLADVIHTLSSTERTRSLLERVPHTRDAAREHFERDERALSNVQYTISANVAYLRPIAALWHHSSRRLSLTDWIRGEESILLLGTKEDLRCPIDAVNRALFQRIVELILDQTESDTRTTWFILDELREAGALTGLGRLMTKGRSKGARVVVAFQTIEGLRDAYGDRLAGEISGMAANKCFLRTDSEETAAWMSRVVGEAEYRQWTVSSGPNGTTSTDGFVKKEVVYPSEFLRLPLANRERFWSYCITPCIGVYHGPTSFGRILRPKGKTPNFIPRPDAHQYLPADLLDADEPTLPSLDEIRRVRLKHDGFEQQK